MQSPFFAKPAVAPEKKEEKREVKREEKREVKREEEEQDSVGKSADRPPRRTASRASSSRLSGLLHEEALFEEAAFAWDDEEQDALLRAVGLLGDGAEDLARQRVDFVNGDDQEEQEEEGQEEENEEEEERPAKRARVASRKPRVTATAASAALARLARLVERDEEENEGRVVSKAVGVHTLDAPVAQGEPRVTSEEALARLVRRRRRGGISAERTVPLTEEQAGQVRALEPVFPQLTLEQRAEVVRFAQQVAARHTSLYDLTLTDRERRMADVAVERAVRQKFATFRGRFQGLLAKTERNADGWIEPEQWKEVLLLCSAYEDDYFRFFTSRQRCRGAFRSGGCKYGPSESMPASIDFLYAAFEERKLFVLDHEVEVAVIARTWRERVQDVGWAGHDPSLYVHLLLSLQPDKRHGPPNLSLRCRGCDSTRRHGLRVDVNDEDVETYREQRA